MAFESATKFVGLSFDIRQIESNFADMSDAFRKATAQTLNKVGTKANRNIARNIKDTYNIPARALKIGRLVKLKRADARKKFGGVFTIRIRKQGRGLMKYSPQSSKVGVSVKVKKSRKTLNRAFITSWRKGGVQGAQFVFRTNKRASKITRYSKKGTPYKAYPRKALFGPSVAGLYRRRKSRRILVETINEEYQKELDKQFNQQFEKKRR